jgi:histidine phosphotransferase ChpT
MADSTELKVASLLASRLCHDLVGPLGAVGNGLELVAEDGGMAAEALALAQRSAKRATSRLQFFRYAFGAAGGDPNFGLADARSLANGLLHNGDVTLDWSDSPANMNLPTGAGRLLLNLLLLGSECLPRGGRIRVVLAPDRVAVEATGPQARLPSELKSVISGPATSAALTARTVGAYYAAQLAAGLGGRLDAVDQMPGMVRLQTTVSIRGT